MNNSLKTLLAASLVVGTTYANHDFDATNKTFMAVRPWWTMDLSRQYSGIWDYIYHPKQEGKFGGFLNVTGAYNATTKSSDLGKYYGFNHCNCFTVGTCSTGDCSTENNIDRAHIIQRSEFAGAGTLAGQFCIAFEKKRWAVQFDYYQDLGCIWRGLYLEVKLPVAHDKLESCINNECMTCEDICCTSGSTVSSRSVNINNFFSGDLSQSCNAACYPISEAQCPLTRAKIDPCCSQGETGVGDIDVKIGYNYLQGEDYNLNINLGITIPTGNTPDGCWVAEPVVGNGGGVGFGGGFVNYFTPWKKNNKSLEMHIVLDYRYFFSNDECRTLGRKGWPWAQYMAIGTIGAPGVQPFANVSTMNVSVVRGSHVDALIGVAYHHGNFCFDLGYEVFGREQETVKLDECSDLCCFGFAGWDYVSCNNFTTSDIATCDDRIQCRSNKASTAVGVASNTGSPIARCDLDTTVAETPGTVTQKIYAGASYGFKKWEYPLLLRIGGYYDFATRSNASNWSVYGGAGVAF